VQGVDLGEIQKEIIIIDDCSTDNTKSLLLGWQEKYKIIFKAVNQGKGAAIRDGLKASTGDIVIIQDADLEYDPNEYPEIIQPIIDNKADVVYGSRFISDRPHRVLYFWHYLGNRGLTWLSNMFTNLNLTDMETCYKAMNRKTVDLIKDQLTSNRFGIEPELTALVAQNQLVIFEVGVSYYGRTYEEGKKINYKDGLMAFWHIFRFNVLTKKNYLKLKKSPYTYLILLCLINILFAYFYIQDPNPFTPRGDAFSYRDAMALNRGEISLDEVRQQPLDGNSALVRVLTSPLLIKSSIFFSYFTGGYFSGLLTVNIIFYFLLTVVFYKLARLVLENDRAAFLATILLAGNYCAYNYGITFVADIGGWFFMTLASFFAVRYFLSPKKSEYFYYAILASAIGTLFKETGALGMLSLGCLILWQPNFTLPQKIRKILLAAVLYPILPLLYQLYVYWQYNFSYFDWYYYNLNAYLLNSNDSGSRYSMILLIKVLGWMFLAGWPIFIYGLYWQYKNWSLKRFKILSSLLPQGLSFLAWPALTQRIAFVFGPWLSLVGGFGLAKIKNRYLLSAIVIAYLLINYNIRYLMKIINL